MDKEFIPYEQALELKELGFDEPCFGYHLDNKFQFFADVRSCNTNSEFKFYPTAPTYSQAFRFFREKYNLRGFIGFRPNVKQFDCHVYDMSLSGKEYVKQRTMEEYNKDPKVGTYEEAELECLNILIKICKK
jgi:hypothetical protein